MSTPQSLQEYLDLIDQKFAEIQSIRPLNEGELQELQKSLKVAFTYHSNAVEGSTITLGETKILLEDGLTVAGKPLREITETTNHNAMLEWLYQCIYARSIISEKAIQVLHQLVLKGIDDDNAGTYRSIQVSITGEETLPPAANDIPVLMEGLVAWYAEQKDDLHPVELAARFHYQFVKIHPFIDGNGRAIRILVNLILMQYGYPMVIIPVVRRAEYMQSLHSTASKEDFLTFFASVVYENLKDYLRMITP